MSTDPEPDARGEGRRDGDAGDSPDPVDAEPLEDDEVNDTERRYGEDESPA